MEPIGISEKIEQFSLQLSRELQKELPGFAAQKIMAPSSREDAMKTADPSKAQSCSVLLLLYPKAEQITISFIKRPPGNYYHSNQVSFPGGKREKSDSSLFETALRETREELGIDTDNLKILGALTKLYIPVSNFMVLPVVGFLSNVPIFNPNPQEVKKIIEVPLTSLINTNNTGQEEIKNKGRLIRAPYFKVNGYKIWGATAMIICELNVLLKRLDFNS